jgi:hypothetical protein
MMNGQSNRRSYMIVRDNHGREWGVNAETSRGQMSAVGPFEPIGWSAPWTPPSQYMQLDPRAHLQRVNIDYVTLIADRKQAEKEYKKRARLVGQKLHGQRFDAKAPPTQQMIEEIGFPPHPWQLASAAQKGDRYILGLTEKVNPAVAKYLPRPDEEGADISDDELDLGEDDEVETEKQPRGKRQPAGAGV